VFNIVGNLLAIILIDSSVFASEELMTTSRFQSDPTAKDWHLCDKCELVVPPRSWHCETCDVCILKRDHHCMFASNCVGLVNHRNFLLFLFYFFIGTTYSVIYNSYYIWILNSHIFATWSTAFKMALPMFMAFYSSGKELHLLFYMLVIIGSALSGVLIIYHGQLVTKNSLTHEKNKGAYDLGLVDNMKIIFGSRWLLSMVWPFTESPVPKVYWQPAESTKSK
jgi:palmitoyltransferase